MLFLLSICFSRLTGQTVSREVIAAAGGSSVTPTLRLSWIAGDAITGPLSGADLRITQGFQQGTLQLDPTAVSELARAWQLTVYPNPTAGRLQLDRRQAAEKMQLAISVYTTDGRRTDKEWRWPAGEAFLRIDLQELPPAATSCN